MTYKWSSSNSTDSRSDEKETQWVLSIFMTETRVLLTQFEKKSIPRLTAHHTPTHLQVYGFWKESLKIFILLDKLNKYIDVFQPSVFRNYTSAVAERHSVRFSACVDAA